MHRIDTDSAIDNKFVSGTPQTGQGATQLNPAWCNSVQEEISQAIEGAGLALDAGADNQLLAAIQTLIADAFASSPHVTQLLEGKELHTTLYDNTHYLKPAGQSLLRADYPEAWAAIQNSGQLAATHADWLVAPTLWGPGVDALHFDMKDLRAVFRRVDNDGKAGALGPVLGGFKANQNASHTHTFAVDQADSTGSFVADSDGSSTDHTITTSASGGNEAVPDHTSLRYVIRMK